ncbi:polysaccharide deacetylase family protein [Flavihumibacter stibioxidans]|uniref:NodB homology domain-containing protein n=1 Tax=Flavihumibacter stibioxidans TaxID=1834163 RepID=A0ABR7MA28_9BACT|nr:polysaccharide deacetylase family protein [Flavihumibacter stibioxidans]MBC6491880.1 hypothetical protein [Flavihumibacter stibioxidans]
MLNFRNTSIAALVLMLAGWFGGMPTSYYAISLLAYLAVLVWGSARVDSQFYLPVVCSGQNNFSGGGGSRGAAGKGGAAGKKQIAISFDDGPVLQYTPELLRLLKDKSVPAAFFCIGSRVAARPDLLRQAHEAGHLIGNHSYGHAPLFDLYGANRMEKELHATNELVYGIIGHRPRLFRPPYGVTNPNLASAVRRSGMKAIGWNIRSLDTVAKDEGRLFKKLLRSLQPGAILLFHDTAKVTLDILPAFIDEARERGYDFVRLDELINENPYA